MATIIRGNSDSRLLVTGNGAWFLGTDSVWYKFGFVDSGGVYLWNLLDSSTSRPRGTRNFSHPVMGSAFYMTDPGGTIHQLIMTATDTPGGYAWTDYAQTTSVPTTRFTYETVRFDDGLRLIDVDGHQIHVMQPTTGGTWAESSQE